MTDEAVSTVDKMQCFSQTTGRELSSLQGPTFRIHNIKNLKAEGVLILVVHHELRTTPRSVSVMQVVTQDHIP